MTSKTRKPAAFPIPEETDKAAPKKTVSQQRASRARSPTAVAEDIVITEPQDDPFLPAETGNAEEIALVDELTPPVAKPHRRRVSFGKLALTALGLLFSLAFAMWVEGFITELFARSAWLGSTASALTAIAVFALLGIAVREFAALSRLEAVHSMRSQVEEARLEKNPAKAKTAQKRLIQLFSGNPETARARRQLSDLEGEIIDGPHLIELTETELLKSLDDEARHMGINLTSTRSDLRHDLRRLHAMLRAHLGGDRQ
ncbi:MAG: hypothetical protein AAGC96_15620 [Pseudomonadota bacterium]